MRFVDMTVLLYAGSRVEEERENAEGCEGDPVSHGPRAVARSLASATDAAISEAARSSGYWSSCRRISPLVRTITDVRVGSRFRDTACSPQPSISRAPAVDLTQAAASDGTVSLLPQDHHAFP